MRVKLFTMVLLIYMAANVSAYTNESFFVTQKNNTQEFLFFYELETIKMNMLSFGVCNINSNCIECDNNQDGNGDGICNSGESCVRHCLTPNGMINYSKNSETTYSLGTSPSFIQSFTLLINDTDSSSIVDYWNFEEGAGLSSSSLFSAGIINITSENLWTTLGNPGNALNFTNFPTNQDPWLGTPAHQWGNLPQNYSGLFDGSNNFTIEVDIKLNYNKYNSTDHVLGGNPDYLDDIPHQYFLDFNGDANLRIDTEWGTSKLEFVNGRAITYAKLNTISFDQWYKLINTYNTIDGGTYCIYLMSRNNSESNCITSGGTPNVPVASSKIGCEYDNTDCANAAIDNLIIRNVDRMT